jgi:branched-chain amino acid transport system substrate-binding protein
MFSKLMACLLAGTALAGVAHAADPAPIRITVIADLDDDLYGARAGRGGVDATRMAVADFGGSVLGRPVLVDALNDHNKAAEAPCARHPSL